MSPVVLRCRACSTALTVPVERLPALPARQPDGGAGYAPTVPSGSWAVDPDPWTRRPDGAPVDTAGCLVVHPDDGRALARHPERRRSSGCCGHDGCDGPNQVCAGCGAEVATLLDDCWTWVELRYEPAAVVASEGLP